MCNMITLVILAQTCALPVPYSVTQNVSYQAFHSRFIASTNTMQYTDNLICDFPNLCNFRTSATS